jgi:hypothetical protein
MMLLSEPVTRHGLTAARVPGDLGATHVDWLNTPHIRRPWGDLDDER